MITHAYPLLEFDPTREAIIEPGKVIAPLPAMPERCVLCFFGEVLQDLRHAGRLEFLYHCVSEMGKHPVYTLEVFAGERVAVFQSGVGAALAVGLMEELIALGGRKFIACGGAGVLERDMAVGHVVIPDCAVRDEGTSYHYVAPSREVVGDPVAIAAIERVLQRHGVPYRVGKTWTTDAFYRETPNKVARRRAEGCLTVEMETAAFFALAQFRGVTFGQLLYAGDDVSGVEWDHRDWEKCTSVRERLFWLAVEAALELRAESGAVS